MNLETVLSIIAVSSALVVLFGIRFLIKHGRSSSVLSLVLSSAAVTISIVFTLTDHSIAEIGSIVIIASMLVAIHISKQ